MSKWGKLAKLQAMADEKTLEECEPHAEKWGQKEVEVGKPALKLKKKIINKKKKKMLEDSPFARFEALPPEEPEGAHWFRVSVTIDS